MNIDKVVWIFKDKPVQSGPSKKTKKKPVQQGVGRRRFFKNELFC